MKLRISAAAEKQLGAIERRIAADSPRAASEIRKAAELLADLPWMGRPGLAQGTREWHVRGRPYLIVYEMAERRGELVVLAVFHGARDRDI